MRKVLPGVLALVATVAMLASPVLGQAPTPKVTITGLVDNVLSFKENYGRNDLDLTRRAREVKARTRARPDITAELGTTKFVLGIELDFSYGQSSSNRDQAADQGFNRGSQSFGESTGSTLNTDIAQLVEFKWIYTEFDLPWMPVRSRLRVGAQPFDVHYKLGMFAQSDFAGFHYTATFTPATKLNIDYVFITQRATGKGDGFLRGQDFAIIVDPEITPFKGLDLRPMISWIQLNGSTTDSFSGPRLARGGVLTRGGAACTPPPNPVAATQTPLAGPGAPTLNTFPTNGIAVPGRIGPAVVPCFPKGSEENRYTLGFDARWRSGPFSLEPTFYYQFGERGMVSSTGKFSAAGGGCSHPTPPVSVGCGTKTQQLRAWIADVRGGFRAGPLLIELGTTYTPGNGARSDIRNANTTMRSYQPLVTDSGFYSGWAEIMAGGVDYFNSLRANAPSLSTRTGLSYDKYGLGRVAARITYALTPALSVYSKANATWTAEPVDTHGLVNSSGITPCTPVGVGLTPPAAGALGSFAGGTIACNPNTGRRHYLGTEIDIGLTYRFAPGMTFDLVGGYLFAGQALNAAASTPVCGTDGLNTTCGFTRRSSGDAKDVEAVAARFRYTF